MKKREDERGLVKWGGEWGSLNQAPTGGKQTGTVGSLCAGCREAWDQPGSVRKKGGSVEVILITYICVGAVGCQPSAISGQQNRKEAGVGESGFSG